MNRLKTDKARRRLALQQATPDGVWTLLGTDECAISCADCQRPLLILRRRSESGPAYCLPCGSIRFREPARG